MRYTDDENLSQSAAEQRAAADRINVTFIRQLGCLFSCFPAAEPQRYAATFDFMHKFPWLASQVLDGLVYGWPITLGLLGLIGIASVYAFPFTPSRFRTKYLLIFSPLLLSLLLLFWGTVMNHHSPTKAPSWPSVVVTLLFFLHLPVGALLVRFMKGFRLFAVSVLLFQIWVGFFCQMMAGMSVTNVWM